MKRAWYHLAVLVTLGLWAAVAFAYPGGASSSRTGATAIGGLAAESSCRGCHSGNALNTGGSVSILGVPTLFRAGSTYRLTVRVASTQTSGSSTRNWGFQLTAVDTANGLGAGTFGVVDAAQTGIVNGSGAFSTRRYVNQLSGGVKGGTAAPADWLVDWTAPVSSSTGIRFFASGLAGDGDGSEAGDWVYTGTAASADTVTSAIPTTWGAVKASYRK